MSIAIFFLLAVVVAAVIAQPLLPGSRADGHKALYYGGAGAGGRPPAPALWAAQRGGPTCAACGAAVKDGDRFCVRCGGTLAAAPPARACASCGAALAEDDRFCRKCGAVAEAGEGHP